jgi:hypothetical protein
VRSVAENQPFSFADSIREARRRLSLDLRAQAEQLQKLHLQLRELQQIQERTEKGAARQWDEMALVAAGQFSPETVLENVLSAVRSLMTCTVPEQLFAVLTEEASQWGVRAAIFDVRGKAAWAASANGFGPALMEKVLRSLIVPLNQDNPFREVWETAGPVDATAHSLRKNRNVLDKLKPDPRAPVLLLPIRSAGTVAAILYADPGENRDSLPVNALMILAEFAGAQIDRLIALSGGFSTGETEQTVEPSTQSEAAIEEPAANIAAQEPVLTEALVKEPLVEAASPGPEPVESPVEEPPESEPGVEEPDLPEPVEPPLEEPPDREPGVEEPSRGAHADADWAEPLLVEAEASAEMTLQPESAISAPASEVATPVAEAAVELESSPAPVEDLPPVEVVEVAALPTPAAPVTVEVAPLSPSEQKLRIDARRFAKLLVSEIELYNKVKVADGRKNQDLYKRLKNDIDRSRQTFEKRFGKALNNEVDFFYDELVKTLAVNDSANLGPDYPGPTA